MVLAGAERGGGHGRDNLHTFALLQRARGRLDVPVVASGGIVDGCGMLPRSRSAQQACGWGLASSPRLRVRVTVCAGAT